VILGRSARARAVVRFFPIVTRLDPAAGQQTCWPRERGTLITNR
jgi:hypothetical protein